MPYFRQDKTLVFLSSREVITYYTNLIDELMPQFQGVTLEDYQAIRVELANLRQQLADHLKDFGHRQVDAYFTGAICDAESDPELYALSNAYETILMTELKRIKAALHSLRTT